MPIAEFEYSWLTSPLEVSDILGSPEGLPLPFLLRHGICTYPPPDTPDISLEEKANNIENGLRRFYLSSVGANGVGLELNTSFFWPELLRMGIVVGPEAFSALGGFSGANGGFAVAVDPRTVYMHNLKYSLPRSPSDQSLYVALRKVLRANVGEMGDDKLMQKLCESCPFDGRPPQLHVLLPPMIGPGFSEAPKLTMNGTIVLSIGREVKVRDRDGDSFLSASYLREHPLLSHHGFLFPRDIAAKFQQDYSCRWAAVSCFKDVILRIDE